MPVLKNPSQRSKPCGADILYIGSGEHSCLLNETKLFSKVPELYDPKNDSRHIIQELFEIANGKTAVRREFSRT